MEWTAEVNFSCVISAAFPKATLPKESKECSISSSTVWRMQSKRRKKKKKKNSEKLYICLWLEAVTGWRHFCTIPAPKFQKALLPSPPVEQTRMVHTLRLPVAQSTSPAPDCSGKMDKTEFKNSEQRFSWVFAAFGPLLFLAVDFAAFGNGSTQALCKSDIPSNRSKELSSVHAFQKLKVYWDCKQFKMLLGMQYGALNSHVYQMAALNKRHQLCH